MSEEAARHLAEIVQTEDLQLCRAILRAHDGNMHAAITDYLARGAAAAQTAPAPALARRGLFGLLRAVVGGVFSLGLSVIHAVFRLVAAPLLGNGPRGTRLFELAASRSETEDPATAAGAFAREFAAAFGAQHPRFLRCSYRDALQRAQQESKFLLLYLHSPAHQNTAAFCAQTLCAPAVVEFIDSNLLIWGGDVRHSEAYQVSGSLRNSTFPYLALVLHTAGGRFNRVAAFEGSMEADRLVQLLAQAVEDHGAALVAARADAEERDYNRLLRAQQDEEYEASLNADRERAAREEVLQQAAASEAAQREAQEAADAAAAAEAQRLADERAATLAARQAAKAAALAPEPPAGPGVTQIVLRLPDGSRVQRRFGCEAATVADLYDWAEAQGVQAASFSLVSSFPRAVYAREAQTLQSVGLTTQTALLVEARE